MNLRGKNDKCLKINIFGGLSKHLALIFNQQIRMPEPHCPDSEQIPDIKIYTYNPHI